MLINCLYCAICAHIIADHISLPGEILAPYGEFLERLNAGRFRWLAKPLGMCGKCFSGQIALWTFPFWCGHYHPAAHAVAICTTIFLYLCLSKISNL